MWTNDAGFITAAALTGYARLATNNLFTANQEIRLTTEQLRLGYDASNYATFTVGSTGILTIVQTAGTATVMANGLATNGTSANSNFWVVGSTAASNTASLAFGGAASGGGRVYMKGVSSTTLGINNNYSNLFVGASPFTKGSSGTHNIAANCVIQPIGTIGAGAATLNNTVSLYIEGATTGGTLGNYALWVDAGKCRFDEVIQLQSYTNSTPADTDFWFDGTNLKFRIGGVTKTITWA